MNQSKSPNKKTTVHSPFKPPQPQPKPKSQLSKTTISSSGSWAQFSLESKLESDLPVGVAQNSKCASLSYSEIVKQPLIITKQPISLSFKRIPMPVLESASNLPPKKGAPKTNRHCYTCKPRGKVLKHVIEKSTLKNVMFHFDLHKRPIILVTPITHYNNIYEIPNTELFGIFESIKYFCDEWNIKDYQISFNNGEWQSHSHFHIKIKTNENFINRLKKDHFKMHKLHKNYENNAVSAEISSLN